MLMHIVKRYVIVVLFITIRTYKSVSILTQCITYVLIFDTEIASDVFLKHRHDLTVLIKAQDENFFSQFVPCKVVTLGAYGDCNTIQEKAEMILMKITSHLAAGDSDSFMILLKIMQHYGDGTCDKRAKCILNELDNHQQPLLSGTVDYCKIYY